MSLGDGAAGLLLAMAIIHIIRLAFHRIKHGYWPW